MWRGSTSGYPCISLVPWLLPVFMNFAMFVHSVLNNYLDRVWSGFEEDFSAARLSLYIVQYDWVHVLNSECFTENFIDILTHAQTVCTRPFLLHKGPGGVTIPMLGFSGCSLFFLTCHILTQPKQCSPVTGHCAGIWSCLVYSWL